MVVGVQRFVVSEAALIVGAGALLGLAVTVPPLLAMAHGIEEETGLPVPLHLHWPSVAAVVAACLCAAFLGTILNLRGRADRGGVWVTGG